MEILLLFPHQRSKLSPLEKTEQEELAAIYQAIPTANTVYELTQDFMSILLHCEGERLDTWLENVRNSQICELQRMVRSIEKDKAVVLAGLTLPHSNGQVEEQVTRIKLIKRMMYGRAGFALLLARQFWEQGQRAYTRLSWQERLTRNARISTSEQVRSDCSALQKLLPPRSGWQRLNTPLRDVGCLSLQQTCFSEERYVSLLSLLFRRHARVLLSRV